MKGQFFKTANGRFINASTVREIKAERGELDKETEFCQHRAILVMHHDEEVLWFEKSDFYEAGIWVEIEDRLSA